MPATATHALFAKDVYDILPKEISKKLDLKRLETFAQGTDSLMFYNLLSFVPGKSIRKLQHYSHDNKTRDLFINLLNYMRGNKINDVDTYSFLVGFICHYVLDSTIHPYIIYKTGYFVRGNPNTYKYNGIHHFMETFIDNDMIKKRLNTDPYKYDIAGNFFDTRVFSKKLNNAINYTFYSTFKVKNMGNIYYKSLKQERSFIRLFRQDSHGIKKFFYKLLDTFTPRGLYRFESLSYHYPMEDKHNFLNSNNSVWRNPTTYDLTSKESFIDLYIKAIKNAKSIINDSFDYLNGKNILLENVFTNLSYYTGLDCDNKKVLKYYEF